MLYSPILSIFHLSLWIFVVADVVVITLLLNMGCCTNVVLLSPSVESIPVVNIVDSDADGVPVSFTGMIKDCGVVGKS